MSGFPGLMEGIGIGTFTVTEGTPDVPLQRHAILPRSSAVYHNMLNISNECMLLEGLACLPLDLRMGQAPASHCRKRSERHVLGPGVP